MTRYLAIALAVAVALLTVQSVRVARLKTDVIEIAAERDAAGLERDAVAEQARENAQTAVDDSNDTAAACEARLAEARRSSVVLRNLLNQEVPRDPQGCPVRAMLDPDGVREAIGAPAVRAVPADSGN